MTGFFERAPGDKSMMRLLAFMGGCCGGAMVLTSCFVLVLVALGKSPVEAASAATVMGPSGVAVFGVSQWMKQRQSETEATQGTQSPK